MSAASQPALQKRKDGAHSAVVTPAKKGRPPVQEFLKIAGALLTAAGFPPDNLVLRDAREPNWQRGLKQTAAVVCDSLTAAEIPTGCRAIPFFLISELSLEELRRYAEFVHQPIESV